MHKLFSDVFLTSVCFIINMMTKIYSDLNFSPFWTTPHTTLFQYRNLYRFQILKYNILYARIYIQIHN